jgi:ABC-2 type transport system permease protein
VIPLSTVITGAMNLGLNLIVVFGFMLAFGVEPTWTWLLFPVGVAALFVLTAAVCMALSVLYVRFRDVAIIWVVLGQVLFYATPILYPVTAFNGPPVQQFRGIPYEHLLMLNPLAVIFEQIRVWVLSEPGAPSAVQAAGGALHLIPAAVIYVVVCAFAVWIFRRDAPRIAENL